MEPESTRRHGFQGHGSSLFTIAVVFFVIALLAVGSRCAIRRARRHTFGLDDYLMIASLFFSFLLSLDVAIGVYVGYGARSATLSATDRMSALKSFYACQILYKFLINSTKASILALYHRIFPGKAFRRAVYVTAVVFVGYGIGSIIATIFECLPIPRTWDRSIPGTCFNLEVFWYTNASMNIFGDIVILILPMYSIWKLHLGRNERAALVGVFGLGMFVTVTSILRMQELKPGSRAIDQSYGTMSSTLWSVIEPNTGILCACLPLLKVPIMAWFPRLFAPSNNNASSDGVHPFSSASPNARRPSVTTNSTELESLAMFSYSPKKAHGPRSDGAVRQTQARTSVGGPQFPERRPRDRRSLGRAWFQPFDRFAGRAGAARDSRTGMRWVGNHSGRTRSGQSSDEELRVNVTKDIDVRYEEKEGSASSERSGRRDDDEALTVIDLR